MPRLSDLYSQIHKNLFSLALVIAISSIPIGLVVFLRVWKDIPPEALLRDPVMFLGGEVYVGMASQFGIFLWAAAAAIPLFAGYLVGCHGESSKLRNFLVASGFLSLLLGFDDVFMLHDEVFPDSVEKIVYLVYASAVLAFLVRFQSIIRRTDYLLLVMAFVFFAISIGLDQLHLPDINGFFWEDSAKIVGIAAWLVYFFQASAFSINVMLLKQRTAPIPQVALKR
ncbi:hypothetical protein [Nodosilinea sp. E11]|uniref:hypothetical protein n=1 Tax=Nodosilinea sp. E11 TaxID=3037479 RepID=UPI00293502B8|nr:hypothetical protein [Nodosilinea sp. E11]WOD40011.1 hypothetical protein RRF56_04320 [Nodosilinea sp. E11]